MVVSEQRTSQCNVCLPRFLPMYPIEVLVENEGSANNIDIVFERSI